MARVRAYKIAEELGLAKEDLVKRAAEFGIELRSAMVALDEEQAEELRSKLGAGKHTTSVEKRVASGVIRRRRKVVKPPEPEAAPPEAEEPSAPPEPELEPAEPVLAEPEPTPTEEVPEAPPVELPPPPTPPAAEPGLAAEAETTAEMRPAAEAAPGPAAATPTPPATATPVRRAGAPAEEAATGRGLGRKQIIEGFNLREQERLARQMRGNVQSQLERRRQIVEAQSRMQPQRRRATAASRKAPRIPRPERKKLLKLSRPLALAELSRETGVKVQELLRRARSLELEISRDELVDLETAELIAADLGVEVQQVGTDPEQEAVASVATGTEDLEPRAPVVTVMGHVDHGKTSLLDTIRRADVVAGEAGGITQHIGAYRVEANDTQITFLDTPGHEAFTQMRARGAQVTDIAVLVVAADDGVMPQTVEAISHAQAAGVPIIVAVNKIDRPDANPQRVKQGLLEHGLVPEDLGGDVLCVEVSATKGTHVDKLLEAIALQAELLELRSRRMGPARGIVIEARLDKGRGPVASVLVQEGTLERGDALVAGTAHGRVRTLTNERGDVLKEAGPSMPVQVVGLASVPEAGEEVLVLPNEREAKALADHRVAEQRRAASGEAVEPVAAEALFAQLEESEERELRIVLKADVRGTAEAIREAMAKLSTERVRVRVIHSGVGAITESDVMLASASEAEIIGFHVRPEASARRAAEEERVEIRTYDVVYEVLEDTTLKMQGLLPPKVVERVAGHAEVRRLFQIPRAGTVAGCQVADGVIRRANRVRVVRDGVPVYSGRLSSLRRFKDDVREVAAGLECGMSIENFNDVKVGDILESFEIEETPDTL